jgi:hypothetical protein
MPRGTAAAREYRSDDFDREAGCNLLDEVSSPAVDELANGGAGKVVDGPAPALESPRREVARDEPAETGRADPT